MDDTIIRQALPILPISPASFFSIYGALSLSMLLIALQKGLVRPPQIVTDALSRGSEGLRSWWHAWESRRTHRSTDRRLVQDQQDVEAAPSTAMTQQEAVSGRATLELPSGARQRSLLRRNSIS